MANKEKKDDRTHAQRRRAEAQEALRLKFKGDEYIRQIGNDYAKLTKHEKAVEAAKFKKATIKSIVHACLKDESLKTLSKQQINKRATDIAAAIIKECETDLNTAIVKAEACSKIIKLKMDTNFRRLAKVIPDLKSVELTDPDGKNPFVGFATALNKMYEQ